MFSLFRLIAFCFIFCLYFICWYCYVNCLRRWSERWENFWQDMKIAFRFCDNLRKSADAKDGDVDDIENLSFCTKVCVIYLCRYLCVCCFCGCFRGLQTSIRRAIFGFLSIRLVWMDFFMILRRIERTLWLCWRLYDWSGCCETYTYLYTQPAEHTHSLSGSLSLFPSVSLSSTLWEMRASIAYHRGKKIAAVFAV